jgi:hypothetical protein
VFGKRVCKEKQMDLNSKLAVLDQIYRVYDEFVARLHTACKKYCAGCCTRNVILTTLEGYLIATHMISYGKSSLFENIERATPERHFQPKTTTNRLADLCMKGENPPEEKHENANVNNLFLQFIEHVDSQGFSGNLIDVLKFMATKNNRHNYKGNTLNNPDTGLIPNLKITVLMIPPEHRVKIKPILNALQNIKPDL